jgi:hypothetical protein
MIIINRQFALRMHGKRNSLVRLLVELRNRMNRLCLKLLRSVGNFMWNKREGPEGRLEGKLYFCSSIKYLSSVTKVTEAAAVRLSVQAVAAAYIACWHKSIFGLQYGQAARSHVHFN